MNPFRIACVSLDTSTVELQPEKHAPGANTGSFVSWSSIKDINGETTIVRPDESDEKAQMPPPKITAGRKKHKLLPPPVGNISKERWD